MRPMINPALRALWRDEHTLQLGVDPERAVVLAGLDASRATFLSLLDGSRARSRARRPAEHGCGIQPAEAAALLDLLAAAGALLDGATDQSQLRGLSRLRSVTGWSPIWPRWSLDGASPTPRADAPATIRERGRTGAGRVGATLVGLLAAAGIGSLTVTDERACGPGPGPRRPARPGSPRAARSGGRAVAPRPLARVRTGRRSAPQAGEHGRARPDLVVLCPDGPVVDPLQREQLPADGCRTCWRTPTSRSGWSAPSCSRAPRPA